MTRSLPHPLAPRPPVSPVERHEFALTLLSPAFLGNATQDAQWRTPPLKAMLREWWRVLRANELLREGAAPETLHQRVREEEGRVFGNAWLRGPRNELEASASQVRLRLSSWATGEPWQDGKGPISGQRFDAFTYLAFGPLSNERGASPRTALLPKGSAAKLTILAPAEARIAKILALAGRFACLGSRSRNGWGSLAITGASAFDPSTVTRPLDDCLALDWPHALGSDARGPLLWRHRREFRTWQEAMKALALLRKTSRAALALEKSEFSERHLLGLPVTDHNPSRDANLRLANQFRLKLTGAAGALRPIAFHFPCKFPATLEAEFRGRDHDRVLQRQAEVWRKLHAFMDKQATDWERTQ